MHVRRADNNFWTYIVTQSVTYTLYKCYSNFRFRFRHSYKRRRNNQSQAESGVKSNIWRVTFEGVEQKIKIKCNHDGRFFLAIDSQPQLDRQRYEDTMLSLDGVRLMYGWTIFYRRRGWYSVQRRVWCIGLTYEFNSYRIDCAIIIDRQQQRRYYRC